MCVICLERCGARPIIGYYDVTVAAFHRIFINSCSSRISQMGYKRGACLMRQSGFLDITTQSSIMSASDSSASWLPPPSDPRQRRIVEELLSFSSKASCDTVWRHSGYSSDSQSEQSRWGNRCLSPSNSLQQIYCFPLPGQLPYEPAVSSDGLTPPCAPRASPVSSSSTEKPRERRWMKGLRSFAKKVWRNMKRPFCCCHRSSVDVVEPFALPPDLDPDPEPSTSPGPDHSRVKTSEESFESLYDVVRMIGSGGFGRVYEGTRKFDGKKVAIKRMRKADNKHYLSIPGHPKPLITEVALMLMMRREPRSPYTVQLYEWFDHPRKFTLVMEYPEPCENLLDFMMANPALDEMTAKVIMTQAVLAVQDCIDHGVFHNDIHMQNFLLRKDTLELKLIDFGCGQLLSSDGYDSKTYLGVLEYCPPEVFTEPLFHAIPTNVWALGMMLFVMMNGCFPSHTTTDITQAQVIIHNPDLSEECMDLIGQCLTLDPTQRPTLEQMLQHEWFRDKTIVWSSSEESLVQ